MHPTYVKIVRVFPLLRKDYRGQKSTQFGFATETKRYYDLHISGWPVIEAGMEMTAILEKPGDWQSLQGWVNHTSGEVAAPTRGNWIFQLIASSLMSIIICSSWSSLHPLIILGPYILLCLYFLRRANRVHKALVAVPADIAR